MTECDVESVGDDAFKPKFSLSPYSTRESAGTSVVHAIVAVVSPIVSAPTSETIGAALAEVPVVGAACGEPVEPVVNV